MTTVGYGDISPSTAGGRIVAIATMLFGIGVLGDDQLDATARDAKVVLGALTVKSINPDVYTIVELANAANAKHCERAHANEIVVTSDLGSGLIAQAALDHGITQVVSDLLSSHHGEELYKLAVPASMVGRRFIEVMTEMKQQHASTVLAVQKGSEGPVTCNPPADYSLEKDDHLFVVAAERPEL